MDLRSLQRELNRLIQSPSNAQLEATGAANQWAGTSGLELVGALNRKAGLAVNGTSLELLGVLDLLGWDPITGTMPGHLPLRLPGTSGNYLSTPDSVINSVTGDLDIRVKVALDDWTPAVQSTLVAKYLTTGNQRSYRVSISTSGRILYVFSPDGTTAVSLQSSPGGGLGFADGSVNWLRITHDVDNGAGGHDAKFYTSTDGVTWTQHGTTITTAGVTNIFDSTAVLEVGTFQTGANEPLVGTVYYAEVRNGIDGVIAAKFDAATVTATGSTTPATLNGWTLNGAALYRRDDYVRLPGTSGNYLSFPDTAANSVTGDIDLRAKVSLDDWSPTGFNTLIGKRGAAGQISYYFRVDTGGGLTLGWTADGTNNLTATSSAFAPFSDGTVGWVRVTLDVDNGASSRDAKFYTSTDGVTWVQLGTTQTAGSTTSIFDGNNPVEIGSIVGGTLQLLTGNVYYAEVRSGIAGPVVASFDARDIQTPWTVNGSGWSWQGASVPARPSMALSLPGTAGNYASTPDTASNSVVGDIDLRCKCALTDWTPSASNTFIGKNVGDPNRAFRFINLTDGRLQLEWWPTGSNASLISKPSTVAVPFTDGATGWVRCTLDVDNGASGNTVSFYTSTDGVTWTPLGTPVVTAGVTTMVDVAAAIEVGANFSGGSQQLSGTVFEASVRNGIDGPIVARFDASAVARTGTRTPTTLTQPGGSPNLLTPNQASIETDATGWTASTNAPTLARSTAQFLDGAASLSLTATATGPAVMDAVPTPSTGQPAVAGKSYTARASFRTAVTGRTCAVRILFLDSASVFISAATSGTVVDTTAGWGEAVCTGVAPALTAYAQVQVEVQAAVVTEVHYVDRVSLVESPAVWTVAGSAWDWVAA